MYPLPTNSIAVLLYITFKKKRKMVKRNHATFLKGKEFISI